MSDQPTLNIPRDVIEPIIQANITSAVATALIDHESLIAEVVKQALSVKVDSEGKQSNYTHSNSPTWLQWAVRDAVRRAAKAAIEEYLASHQDVVKKGIAKELATKNSPLAKQLIAGMVGALTSPETLRYRINVICDPPRE